MIRPQRTIASLTAILGILNLTGCGQHFVKPGDDYLIGGKSIITLKNNESLYAHDTHIQFSGISSIELQSGKNIEIPREKVKSILDANVDYWLGARSGAAIGAVGSFVVAMLLNSNSGPPAKDPGAGMQVILIPIGVGLGSIFGGALGGVFGERHIYRFSEETDTHPSKSKEPGL